MNFKEYQKGALTTVLYTGDEFHDLVHFVLGVSGEAAEIAEKLKKVIRDKSAKLSEEDKHNVSIEIGDVLWYLAVLSEHLGLSLEQIAEDNLAKLASRKRRQKLRGSGDNR